MLSRSEAGGAEPVLTDADLAALGVRLVLHPLTALLAAARAASQAYRAIADDGTADAVERMPWAAFTEVSAGAPPIPVAGLAASPRGSTPAGPAHLPRGGGQPYSSENLGS